VLKILKCFTSFLAHHVGVVPTVLVVFAEKVNGNIPHCLLLVCRKMSVMGHLAQTMQSFGLHSFAGIFQVPAQNIVIALPDFGQQSIGRNRLGETSDGARRSISQFKLWGAGSSQGQVSRAGHQG